MKVLIPTSLRPLADGQSTLEFNATNVADALRQTVELHPGLKQRLFTSDGNLVSYINVFVNDQNIRDLQDQATTVGSQDEVLLVPALAGG